MSLNFYFCRALNIDVFVIPISHRNLYILLKIANLEYLKIKQRLNLKKISNRVVTFHIIISRAL